MPTRRQWTLVATIIGSSLTFIDGTVVNVALAALQQDLHASMTDVQWVIEAYALFLGALILVGGSMGDQFGRKRVFLIGVVVFTIASLLCGAAQSTQALIAGRALQGIGAAFLVPGSLAIISATFADAERGRAIGTWSGFSAIMSAIGPVVGGWLIEHVSWRAVFVLNLPLAAIVVLLSWRYMDESHDPARTSQIDWLGGVLAVIGLGGVVFGLLEWPRLGPQPVVLGAIAVGVASLAWLLLVERRARNPMLPLDIFRSRAFSLTNLLTLLLYSALSVVFFLLPMYLIQIHRYSATAAGAALLPVPVIMFVLSHWSGGLVARLGSRLPLTVGPIVVGVGMALLARMGATGSYWGAVFPAAVILGLGLAVTVAPLTTTVMGAVDGHRAGVASGVNNAVARVAGLLAIAVLGVVLARTFDAQIQPRLDRIELSADARAAVERELPKMAGADLDALPLDDGRREQVREAIQMSIVSAFALAMTGAALLAIASGGIGLALR